MHHGFSLAKFKSKHAMGLTVLNSYGNENKAFFLQKTFKIVFNCEENILNECFTHVIPCLK